MSNFVKEAIVDANTVKETVERRAKDMFLKEFSPAVKQMLSNVINEAASTGSDQPGGYAPETDQDKIQGGTDINDGTGDGPEKLKEEDDLPTDDDDQQMDLDNLGEEGSIPPPSDDDELGLDDEPVVEELPPDDVPVDDDDQIPAVEGFSDDDEMGLGGDEDDVLEIADEEEEGKKNESEEEEEESKKNESEEEEEEEEAKKESKKIREAYRKVKFYRRQNKILKETIGVLQNKFRKIDLFNAKLAYAFRLMHQPGLTRNEKKQIAEAFDRARSVRETKIIYTTMKRALESASRKKSVVPKSGNVRSVLSESTKQQNVQTNRMQELAGL